jgi:hypothetical protein
MSMCNSVHMSLVKRLKASAGLLLAALVLFPALPAVASDGDSARWIDFDFPRDSPVLVVSFSLGPTSAKVRGMSMAIDVHASLELRNTGTKPISGLALNVGAQDLSPSGHGSVVLPSLSVPPGGVFPVRIDMELLRPFNVAPKNTGALVQVSLDCALFNDLTSYGPDRLSARRALTVYELEARRDRKYLASLLASNMLPELREELNFGLQDMGPERFGLELSRVAKPRQTGETRMPIETVHFASSPIRAVRAATVIVGNEVLTPSIEVKNRSQRTVRNIDMGWIVRDDHGRDFLAGSIPAPIVLGPVQSETVETPGALRFSRPQGGPLAIQSVLTFVNDVEFGDGQLWIPSRNDIAEATSDPILRRALANSPEQQRLANIYRRRGIAGLAEELLK